MREGVAIAEQSSRKSKHGTRRAEARGDKSCQSLLNPTVDLPAARRLRK